MDKVAFCILDKENLKCYSEFFSCWFNSKYLKLSEYDDKKETSNQSTDKTNGLMKNRKVQFENITDKKSSITMINDRNITSKEKSKAIIGRLDHLLESHRIKKNLGAKPLQNANVSIEVN